MTVPTDTMAALAVDGAAPVAAPVSAAAREKVKQLAQEFESLLMSQMLKEMRKSMLSEDEDQEPGFGAANMTEMMDTALGAALSRAGGFGLADVMLRGLDRQFPVAAPQGAVGAPAVAPVAQDVSPALRVSPTERPVATSLPNAAAVPVSAPTPSPDAAASVISPNGRVSSAYGWRADPLNGQARFHKGTDIALAYGHEVQAAASGRVAFAGEQPGYGMTVVIDHGAGLETRYAHLSGYSVRVGDAVGSGQVVARSGNSGRSTGPHLHFEVLQGGRPVDPKSMATRG